MGPKPNKKKRSQRAFAISVLLITLIIGSFYLTTALCLVGKPFPGFLLRDDLTIGFITRAHWTGQLAGLSYGDQLVSLNTKQVTSPQQIRQIFNDPKKHPITYEFKQGQKTKNAIIPSLYFTIPDFIITFLVPFIVGVLFILVSFFTAFLRPKVEVNRLFLISGALIGLTLMGLLYFNSTGWIETQAFSIPTPKIFIQIFSVLPVIGFFISPAVLIHFATNLLWEKRKFSWVKTVTIITSYFIVITALSVYYGLRTTTNQIPNDLVNIFPSFYLAALVLASVAVVEKRRGAERSIYPWPLKDLDKGIISVTTLEETINLSTNTIAKALDVENCYFMIPNKWTGCFNKFEGKNLSTRQDSEPAATEDLNPDIQISPKEPLYHYLTRDWEIINRWQLETENEPSRREILDKLNILGASIIFPVVFNDHVPLLLCVGPKTSGGAIDNSDIDLIKMVTNQTVLAIEYAKTNDELELKVQERTAELEKSYEKLKKLDRVKTEFFANVSHELRTPLTLAMTPLESMLNGEIGNLNSRQQDYLSLMHTNSLRLLHRINDLLDVSALDANKMPLQLKSLPIGEFCKQIFEMCKPLAQKNSLTLVFEDNSNESKCIFDPEKIERVVFNLLSNAIKFTPEGGKITLRIDENENKICISVQDTGIGIDEKDLPKIFDRFTQIKSHSTKSHTGSGLGLGIAKQLTELHDGSIEVFSKPGQGSTFVITLPEEPACLTRDTKDSILSKQTPVSTHLEANPEFQLLQKIQTLVPGASDIETTKTNYTVLIIDDNPEMLKLVSSILDSYNILTATDGQSGLEMAKKHLPDLIISDLMMPVKDGYQVCKEIKDNRETSNIPVILLSARAETETKLSGLETGADDYIFKPFNPRELRAKVKSLINLKKTQLYFHTIRTLASVIDSKDPYTHGHSLRVAQYSKMIGQRLNLSKQELEDIELSALLHDIGKIGIPEQILNKTEKLSKEERQIIYAHPEKGFKILQDVKEFQHINKGVRHHHEHYDGKGYPDGLKGEAIPLVARIIAVTDCYDAMTSDRAYRNRYSPAKALEEIKRCSGTQFDPLIVKIFSSIAPGLHHFEG